jgi:hypothetical protein
MEEFHLPTPMSEFPTKLSRQARIYKMTRMALIFLMDWIVQIKFFKQFCFVNILVFFTIGIATETR